MGRGDSDPDERARRGEKIIILDRGNVEFGYPGDWTVTPDPQGYIKLSDPADQARLEASYLRLPPLPPDAPSVEERLRHAPAEAPEAGPLTPVVNVERAGMQLAWAEYRYECDDTKRGWAVPAWQRIVETPRLGDGVPLESRKDHWAVRRWNEGPRPR